jgi:hypothetical protein
LKRADPVTLTEAQQNYRQLLLRQEVERLMQRAGNAAYLSEIADMLKERAKPNQAEPKTRSETLEEDRIKEIVDRMDLFR